MKKDALKFAMRRMGHLLWASLWAPPAIIVGTVVLMLYRGATEPLSQWFRPMSITIPDHCVGDDPAIDYRREIKKPFIGDYTTWFETIDGSFPICRFQSVKISYTPKTQTTAHPKLSQFSGVVCGLEEGQYRASAMWTVERFGFFPAYPRLDSNVFTVLPATAPRCVDSGKQNREKATK